MHLRWRLCAVSLARESGQSRTSAAPAGSSTERDVPRCAPALPGAQRGERSELYHPSCGATQEGTFTRISVLGAPGATCALRGSGRATLATTDIRRSWLGTVVAALAGRRPLTDEP